MGEEGGRGSHEVKKTLILRDVKFSGTLFLAGGLEI